MHQPRNFERIVSNIHTAQALEPSKQRGDTEEVTMSSTRAAGLLFLLLAPFKRVVRQFYGSNIILPHPHHQRLAALTHGQHGLAITIADNEGLRQVRQKKEDKGHCIQMYVTMAKIDLWVCVSARYLLVCVCVCVEKEGRRRKGWAVVEALVLCAVLWEGGKEGSRGKGMRIDCSRREDKQ
jgi:hypothetical protein